MASEVLNLKVAGLQTNYQSLMEISPGALLTANNTVINRESIIEPRRGFKVNSTFNQKIKQLIEYKGVLISHIGSQLVYNINNSLGVFSGLYNEPSSGYRIKSVEAKGNLYFTTNEGVKKLSVSSSSEFSSSFIEDAGGPKALPPVLTLSGSSGFLPTSTSVSYRILWIYTDANDNLIFGAPSTPITISNSTGGSRNVLVSFQIPYDVNSTDYKYRIYRSEYSTSPSDEMRLVYEANVTSAELSSLSGIGIIDNVTEVVRVGGVPLYTNEYSGEGALKSNEPPPAAKDIALFKGHMFYANTRTRHLLSFSLRSLPLLNSFIVISTGTTSQTYTFKSTTDYANNFVAIKATAKETALELSNVINGNALDVTAAYYVSTIGDTEGKLVLQKRDVIDTMFKIFGDVDPLIIPNIGTTFSNTNLKSETEKFGHRLYWSKYQEHEAVPLLNYIDIGARDQEILRIVSLRESLFIFKGDGVFKLAGDPGVNPTWDVGAFDNTSILKAPDTAVLMGNNCYYFSNQGIVRLNETALEVISNPIKNKLVPFIATNNSLPTVSFSVGYESDNAVLIWTVSKKSDTSAKVCYRYNASTGTWTEWKIEKTCGIVDRVKDKLYLGAVDNKSSTTFYIEEERKNFDRFDYADREYDISLIYSGTAKNILKTSFTDLISAEDVILQRQYVTRTQFNSLLKKLDMDAGLISRVFYQDYRIESGDNLTTKMSNLLDKLSQSDQSTVNYKTEIGWTDPTEFPEIQVKYNLMIGLLNTSTSTYYSNYQESLGSTTYESIVSSVNLSKNEITLISEPPFLQGDIKVYKGIKTEIEYAPQHAGDPAAFKQFSSGTFMFSRRSFYSAQVGYNSDISDSYEEISFVPKSSGIWGEVAWGSGCVWGGQGDQSEIRTFIPTRKQRCRFLGCKFIHGVALESYELYGLSLSVRTYSISDRDYR